MIGGTYGRCTSCQDAGITCHTTVLSKESRSQPFQGQSTKTYAQPAHRQRIKAGKSSAAGPSTTHPIPSPPQATAPTNLDKTHSPYGTHALCEDVDIMMNRAEDAVHRSIQSLRAAVDVLEGRIDSMETIMPPPIGRLSPGSIDENQHRAMVRHYASGAIREAIDISDSSIRHLQGSLSRIRAVPLRLPRVSSGEESDDD